MAPSIRLQIAEAQIKLRELKTELATAEASTEKAAIDAAGGMKALGSNEAERKAALAYAVADSPICRKLQRDIITAEGVLLRLEAAQGDQQDEAQRERWRVRARLCDALEALGMAQPAGFFSSGEIDRAVDEASAEVLYNTGRHVVALRGAEAVANNKDRHLYRDVQEPPPAMQRWREIAAARQADGTWDRLQQEADELFGD